MTDRVLFGLVFLAGALGHHLFIVEQGEFDVFQKRDGKQVKVDHKSAGNVFGELALMYGAPRNATVTAKGPACVWVMDRWKFRRIAQDIGEATLKKYSDFLAKVSLLKPLSSLERNKITETLSEEAFEEGEDVFVEGDDANCMYLITEGTD